MVLVSYLIGVALRSARGPLRKIFFFFFLGNNWRIAPWNLHVFNFLPLLSLSPNIFRHYHVHTFLLPTPLATASNVLYIYGISVFSLLLKLDTAPPIIFGRWLFPILRRCEANPSSHFTFFLLAKKWICASEEMIEPYLDFPSLFRRTFIWRKGTWILKSNYENEQTGEQVAGTGILLFKFEPTWFEIELKNNGRRSSNGIDTRAGMSARCEPRWTLNKKEKKKDDCLASRRNVKV